MKTQFKRESAVQLIADSFKQFHLAEKLTDLTGCSSDFYPFADSLGESLFGPEPERDDVSDIYITVFNRIAIDNDLTFKGKAEAFLEQISEYLEKEKKPDCPKTVSNMERGPEGFVMAEAHRENLVLEILEDSIIWYNVSAGLRAVNASYSPFFNNEYGFEPEEQYNGQVMAYKLMGAENDDKGDLLFTLFIAAMDNNKQRPDDRKANAKELAKEIYKDWAMAMYGSTKLSTV